MNHYHQELLEEVKKHIKKSKRDFDLPRYLGHSHVHYVMSVPDKRNLVNTWAKNHKDITVSEFTELLTSLYQGTSYEEKTIAGLLLGYLPRLTKQIDPAHLDIWLEQLEGWAEIDTTCHGNFTAEMLLFDWNIWKKLLPQFADSEYIAKRRASLVLLTDAVKKSADRQLSDLAFDIVDTVKGEKDIRITKAISWLLRDLIIHHRDETARFLKNHEGSLPKIALRETRNKLETGKKSARK